MTFQTLPQIPTLGLGCWAIGGPFTADGQPVGWGEVDDAVSTRAVHAALDHGIRLFDTAQAYGTGHSESVLGAALKGRDDVAVVTKIGIDIDAATRTITPGQTDTTLIRDSIRASAQRLQRDHIDLILLHLNDLPIDTATPIFDMLAGLHRDGTIGAYGWSTDFPDRATAFRDHPGFTTVEMAMNVFFAAEHMVPAVEEAGLIALIRSPLAMGILGGRYDAKSTFAGNDVRSQNQQWHGHFNDGRVSPLRLEQLDAIRDILTSGGRSLAQGALAWLWARSPNAIPIPGFRTPEQVNDLAGALEAGPLTPDQMAEIEALIDRAPEGPPQPR